MRVKWMISVCAISNVISTMRSIIFSRSIFPVWPKNAARPQLVDKLLPLFMVFALISLKHLPLTICWEVKSNNFSGNFQLYASVRMTEKKMRAVVEMFLFNWHRTERERAEKKMCVDIVLLSCNSKRIILRMPLQLHEMSVQLMLRNELNWIVEVDSLSYCVLIP